MKSLLIIILLAASNVLAATTPESIEFFENKIRPVLAQECYQCHRSGAKTKGGLALDHRQALLDGGDSGPALEPSKAGASLLIQVIRHEHDDLKMPKKGAKLDDAVIADFETWIEMGAPDPRDQPASEADIAIDTNWDAVMERRKSWWSFQPIREPSLSGLPSAGERNHPVDRFVLKSLDAAGLEPAPAADAATLIRRLSLTLVGLPPDAQALATARPDINALVDQYLASPRYGERWARHWMDWVRYADSHGSEGDPMIPYAWQYRDYLIRALNDDVPYKQMAREHVAGDLLDKPRINPNLGLNESALGTGHLRMVFHGFAPTDALDEQVRFTDDQINVFSKAFLGLTVSCARCHNHKFDPISQKDFYALYGIFASCPPATIAVDAPESSQATERRNAMQSVKEEIQLELIDAWAKQIPDIATQLQQPNEDLRKAMENAKSPDDLLAPFRPGQNLELLWADWQSKSSRKDDLLRSWDMSKDSDLKLWRHDGQGASEVSPAGSFSIEPDGEVILTGIYPAGTYSHLLSTKDRAVLMSPRFMLDQDYDVWFRITGDGGAVARYSVQNYPRDGTVYPVARLNNNAWEWRRFGLDYWRGDHIHLEITTAADQAVLANTGATRSRFGVRQVVLTRSGAPAPVDCSAFYLALLPQPQPKSIANIASGYAQAAEKALQDWRAHTLTDAQASLLDGLVKSGLLPNQLDQLPSLKTLVHQYRSLEAVIRIPTRAPGVLEKDPYDQALFDRGNHKQPKEIVPRRFLDAIDPSPYQKHASGRRELAEDLFRPDNPLTSRVIVNRVWHHLFGRGLVATPDNFGRLGQKPSHPELLDYLATWFQENNYSIKSLIRFLVTSETWQQSSTSSAEALATDPDNRLWSHANVRRLEAEAIRDSLLSVSSTLDKDTMYGPPMDGDAPRRSVYLRVRRNNLDPFLSTFDAPVPASTKGRRDVTNVPGQALTMLNDRFVIKLAERWAAQPTPATDPGERVRSMFVRSLGRAPEDQELAQALVFIDTITKQRQAASLIRTKLRERIDDLKQDIANLTREANNRVLSKRTTATGSSESNNVAEPIAMWDFEHDLRDQLGQLHGKAKGKAHIEDGMLVLDGHNSFVTTEPLTQTLGEKTLEAWVQLQRLSQGGGGVVSVQDLRGVVFDSIVYAERQPKRWMAGSDGFGRTKDFDGPDETEAALEQPVHLVITYAADGMITGYRNGELIGKPYQSDGPATFRKGDAQILFGLRHGDDDGEGRLLRGRIDEARLYDRALSPDEVAALAARDTAFVTQVERLAAMTSVERANLTEWKAKLADLGAQLDASASQGGLSSPWADLAHALFNLKEFIYVR